MKTAVEWLYDQIENEGKCIYEILEQAKAMEKEQITKAYNSAIPFKFGEQYYNETYKTKTIVTEFRDGSVKVETFKSE
jgi:hypothetical protein